MNDRRILIAFLSVAIIPLLVLMTGCGGGEQSSPAPVTNPAPPPRQAATVAADDDRPAANRLPQRTAQEASATRTDEPEELPPGTYLLGVEANNYVLPMQPEPDPSRQFALYRPPSTAGDSVSNSAQYVRESPVGRASTQPPGARSTFVSPEGFVADESSPLSEEGLPSRIRCEADGAQMPLVPGGVYLQGTNAGSADAAPQHPALVGAFYMDAHETTLAQYREFRDAMREARESVPVDPANVGSPDTHPVLGISWRDAMRYAEWAGKSLPSEAEWELAARGLDSYPYVWGASRPVWPTSRVPGQVDPVGSFPTDRSVFGIYDLAGNAREWCHDFYHEAAYAEATARDGSPLENWLGPNRASNVGHRVVRGSSDGWEAWRRGSHHMSEASSDIGFRCVLRVQVPDEATLPAVSDDE